MDLGKLRAEHLNTQLSSVTSAAEVAVDVSDDTDVLIIINRGPDPVHFAWTPGVVTFSTSTTSASPTVPAQTSGDITIDGDILYLRTATGDTADVVTYGGIIVQ